MTEQQKAILSQCESKNEDALRCLDSMGIDFVSVNTTRLHLQAQRALFDDLRNCPAKLQATRKELKGGV
jgi:hypothetical protein